MHLDKELIEKIVELLDGGMTPDEAAAYLNEQELDSLAADAEDDSDAAIERRYGISPDDRYDSRGREYLPAVNEAGAPWWM